MSAPVKATWHGVPVEDLSRDELVEAVYELGADLARERQGRESADRFFGEALRRATPPRGWSLMGDVR